MPELLMLIDYHNFGGGSPGLGGTIGGSGNLKDLI
jgi:hypothetical protein